MSNLIKISIIILVIVAGIGLYNNRLPSEEEMVASSQVFKDAFIAGCVKEFDSEVIWDDVALYCDCTYNDMLENYGSYKAMLKSLDEVIKDSTMVAYPIEMIEAVEKCNHLLGDWE